MAGTSSVTGVSTLASSWASLGRNETNRGLFKISFGAPKCTETDLKKSQISPIWGQYDPIRMANLPSLLQWCTLSLLYYLWPAVSDPQILLTRKFCFLMQFDTSFNVLPQSIWVHWKDRHSIRYLIEMKTSFQTIDRYYPGYSACSIHFFLKFPKNSYRWNIKTLKRRKCTSWLMSVSNSFTIRKDISSIFYGYLIAHCKTLEYIIL